MTQSSHQDLQDRILGLLDGTLDAAEVARLDADLRASAEARWLFRQLATLHSALEEQGDSHAQMTRTLIPMERLLADQRRAMVRKSLVAAAAILALSALGLWLNLARSDAEILAELRPGYGAVFSLIHEDGQQPAAGTQLREGSGVRIEEGAVELRLATGVRCVVEGPAELTVLAGDRLRLSQGSGWFVVPPTATGFAVETRQMTAVDLGTKFGVLSGRDHPDQVHVVQGRVEVRAPAGAEEGSALVLQAGEACEFDGGQSLRPIDIRAGAFVTELPEAITFVDAQLRAEGGNTVLDGPGELGPVSSQRADGSDGKWSIRTRETMAGGSILVAGMDEDAQPRLRTTFRLPEEGRYALYGYFWNNEEGAGVWDVAFQVGQRRGINHYSRLNAVNLRDQPEFFSSAVPTHDGPQLVLFQAALGTWDTVRLGRQVTIYVDEGQTALEGKDHRTWYDGVGYRKLPKP